MQHLTQPFAFFHQDDAQSRKGMSSDPGKQAQSIAGGQRGGVRHGEATAQIRGRGRAVNGPVRRDAFNVTEGVVLGWFAGTHTYPPTDPPT